jgi:hypothetical protein
MKSFFNATFRFGFLPKIEAGNLGFRCAAASRS